MLFHGNVIIDHVEKILDMLEKARTYTLWYREAAKLNADQNKLIEANSILETIDNIEKMLLGQGKTLKGQYIPDVMKTLKIIIKHIKEMLET